MFYAEGVLVSEAITKDKLLAILHEKRAEFDEAVAAVPQDQMTIPGVDGKDGEWSLKDVIAHLTYYERWMADRMHEQLRGEVYQPTEWDMMHFDERNILIYQKFRDHPLPDVLAASRQAFADIIAGVEAHTEAFLTEPQQFHGMPQPILVWDMLRSEVYDHYRQHIPAIKKWLAVRQSE